MNNDPATFRTFRILVVDDDARLRDLLVRYLTEQGMEVKIAENATQMDKLLQREYIDLIILDLMLPGENGLSICRRLRVNNHTVPIIMLTARGEEVERIIGLEMGADDYLSKPFNPRELLARIHAVLRRHSPSALGAPGKGNNVIRLGEVEVNISARTIKKKGINQVLTSGEFALLRILLEHPSEPLSRDRLMALARGREQGPLDRAIDVQISRLRKLVEPDPAHPRYLQTMRGLGYVYIPDGDA